MRNSLLLCLTLLAKLFEAVLQLAPIIFEGVVKVLHTRQDHTCKELCLSSAHRFVQAPPMEVRDFASAACKNALP